MVKRKRENDSQDITKVIRRRNAAICVINRFFIKSRISCKMLLQGALNHLTGTVFFPVLTYFLLKLEV